MTDLTPSGILKLYRTNMPEPEQQHITMFNAMIPSDRMELLFYMIMSGNAALQQIYQIINPLKQPTHQEPDTSKVN